MVFQKNFFLFFLCYFIFTIYCYLFLYASSSSSSSILWTCWKHWIGYAITKEEKRSVNCLPAMRNTARSAGSNWSILNGLSLAHSLKLSRSIIILSPDFLLIYFSLIQIKINFFFFYFIRKTSPGVFLTSFCFSKFFNYYFSTKFMT